MAIELIENAEDATLQVAVSGKLSSTDYELFEPAVSQLIGAVGIIDWFLFDICEP